MAKEDIEINMQESAVSVVGRRFKPSAGCVDVENVEQEAVKDQGDGSKSARETSRVYKLNLKIGNNADESNTTAEHKDGILKLRIPLVKKTTAHRVAITQP